MMWLRLQMTASWVARTGVVFTFCSNVGPILTVLHDRGLVWCVEVGEAEKEEEEEELDEEADDEWGDSMRAA